MPYPGSSVNRDGPLSELRPVLPHPRTIFEGTFKLPPAHYAVWHEGVLSVERYWQPDWNVERDRPIEEDIEELRTTLGEAVREQMMSDVPLGAFLSGGIDSTIIAGLMQQASSRPVKTFAISFPDPRHDETRYAELAAKHLGITSTGRSSSSRRHGRPCHTLPGTSTNHSPIALPYLRGMSLERPGVRLRSPLRAMRVTNFRQLRPHPRPEPDCAGGPSTRRLLGGAIKRVLPGSGRSKSRLRQLERLFEHINEPAEGALSGLDDDLRELPARARLYSDAQLDFLASKATTP